MAENPDILCAAVLLRVKTTPLAARFSGWVPRRSLKRLDTMDTDAKAEEIIFPEDSVYQLELQVSIRQKQAATRRESAIHRS